MTWQIDNGVIEIFTLNRTATAANYTTLTTDSYIGVTDTSSARTITLLSASVADGRIIIINDESGLAGTNNITIATEGSETIDGSATLVISSNYGVARLISDGTDWFTI